MYLVTLFNQYTCETHYQWFEIEIEACAVAKAYKKRGWQAIVSK